MKILSYRKGFITNSSASNFWFILEKDKDARLSLVEQIETISHLKENEIERSINFFLKDSRELTARNGSFWHQYMRFRRDTHDKIPKFGSLKIPPFGLGYKKISAMEQNQFDKIIIALLRIPWGDLLYETQEKSNKTIIRFLEIIQPISRDKLDDWCVNLAYTELLECAGDLKDPELNEFIMRVLMIYNTDFFDVERAALVNVLYTFLERAAMSKKFKVSLTKARKPDEKFIMKLKNSFKESTGKGLEQAISEGKSGLWEKFLITHRTQGFDYIPLMDVLQSTADFIIKLAGDLSPGLRSVIHCSDFFGLRDDFEKLIAISASQGQADGRVASLLLLRGEKYMYEKIL
jgi:hypothetical protein